MTHVISTAPIYDYTKKDIVSALLKAEIKAGDSVFLHSNIGFFGKLRDATSPQGYYDAFKEAFFDVLGETGTLIVPTFSYSFCWKKKFDKKTVPGICGFLTEAVRTDLQAYRSDDANFSIAAIGSKAQYFTAEAPNLSFGPGSFWEKFLAAGGKMCNLNFPPSSTFIHYVERLCQVPYRFDKKFEGISVIDGKDIDQEFWHFCYDLQKDEHAVSFGMFDVLAKEQGFARCANLGRGQIVNMSAADTLELIRRELPKNPAFLIRGPLY